MARVGTLEIAIRVGEVTRKYEVFSRQSIVSYKVISFSSLVKRFFSGLETRFVLCFS